MNVPLEVYQPMLFQESVAIAGMNRTDDFDALPIITSESATAKTAFPVSLTNVHMVPGATQPRLRKIEERNPGVPADVADMAYEHCVGYMNSSLPAVQYNQIRNAAHAIVATCEDLDEQEDTLITKPFITIGLLAVYITNEGEPFVTEFGLRSFFEALGDRMPETKMDLSRPEEIPEEAYRFMYDLQVEHKELKPYEEWKREGMELLAGDDGGVEGSMGYLGHLLLPKATTHPTVTKILF